MEALQQAIKKAGGVTALSRALGLPSIGRIQQWRIRGNVPADYCPQIELETGIRCEELRPDVPWWVLRAKK